jgi:signal transduction histidine kinase
MGFSLFLFPSAPKRAAPPIHTSPDLPQDLRVDCILASTLFKTTFDRDTHHVLSCIPPQDSQMDPLVKKLKIKACIGTPVLFKQTPLGTLWVIDNTPRSFTQDDASCMETIAAALGLEEERLSQGNKMLKAQKTMVRELSKKLDQAKEMELIGIIAGGVAYDLNNILAGLVSYPEWLLLQMEKNSPLMEPISFIHDTGLRAADIVQDLLSLTRRGIKQTRVINLNQAIQNYQKSSVYQRLVKNFPGIDFKIKSEPDLLNLNGSESHISKVLMNLVMNAAEAIQNSGQVMVETFNCYVDISYWAYTVARPIKK